MLSNKKGFTVFEMLVVMTIIAIIAVLVLARFREGQKIYALSGAAQRLAADLRQAQGMAMAGAETSGYNDIVGYGVYVRSANSYVLYLDTQIDPTKGTGCPSLNGNEASLKTVNLTGAVTISSVKIDGVSVDVGLNPNVFFIPPNSKICINGEPNKEEIEFTLTKDSNSQKVKVNKYGKIDIQ